MGTTRVSRVQLGVPPSYRTSPRLRTPTASAKSAHVRTFGETPKATRETRDARRVCSLSDLPDLMPVQTPTS